MSSQCATKARKREGRREEENTRTEEFLWFFAFEFFASSFAFSRLRGAFISTQKACHGPLQRLSSDDITAPMAVVTSGKFTGMVEQHPDFQFPSRSVLLIVFCISLITVFLRTPSPLSILGDADQCIQLAGAQQIAAGEHPFIDFGADYGPLVFYVAYLAQQLGGHSLAAEFFTCIVGYSLAYVLIFVAMSMVTRRRWLTYGVTLFALIQLPRFYKYYILLGPMLSLCSIMYYLARPTLRRLVLMALCVVITGLFRPDLGAYAVIAAVVSICLAQRSFLGMLKHAVLLGILSIVFSSPWLIFLALHHGLADYFRDSTAVAATHAEGLSHPFPRVDVGLSLVSAHNLEAITYLIWWCLPVVAAVIIAARWKAMDALLRRRSIVTLLFSGLCLLQSAHRAEYGHLIQSIAPAYVLFAITTDQMILLLDGAGEWPACVISAGAITIAGISITAGSKTHSLHGTATKAFPNYYRFYFCHHDEFVRRVSKFSPKDLNVAMIRFVQQNTKPGERVFAVNYFTQLYYFSDRRAGGGQLFLAPGFFSADVDQQRIIDTLDAQHRPLVIECPVGYDNMESRTFRSFEPKVFDYLKSAYRPSIDPGLGDGFIVWRAME